MVALAKHSPPAQFEQPGYFLISISRPSDRKCTESVCRMPLSRKTITFLYFFIGVAAMMLEQLYIRLLMYTQPKERSHCRKHGWATRPQSIWTCWQFKPPNIQHQLVSIVAVTVTVFPQWQLGLQLQPDSLNATSTTTIARKPSLVP